MTQELSGNDAETQLEFWHRLAEQPITSNDDAFHGVLLFLDGEDPAEDYADRVQMLQSRGLLPRDFNEPPEQAVGRGTLAVVLTRALGIRGGWAMHLFGATPRYATRELMYLDLYPTSSPNQTFSGTEFLGVMGKVEDYQRTRQSGSEAEIEDIGTPMEVTPEPRPGAGGEPNPPLQ